MRPVRSFLLLLLSLASLSGLSYLFPGSGLFPSAEVFLPSLSIYSSSHSRITGQPAAVEHNPGSLFRTEPDSSHIADTVRVLNTDSKEKILDPLLDSLRNSKGQVRIMYYGDSQIEGDRITYYLRHMLTERFGGTGPGLFLPVMPVMYTRSLWLRSSSNWEKYNYLSYKSGRLDHNRLGPFMAVCRYLPEGYISPVKEKAYVSIRPSNFADSIVASYELLRIFYSNQKGYAAISIKTDGNIILNDSLRNGAGVHEVICNVKGAREILVEFEGKVSPDIYGISIEGKKGIVVDNIPQRGSAGLEFTMVDRNNLKESYTLLSPDLIILHYGLNIVKNVRNNYSFYERGLLRQLLLLRQVAPSARILVAGVTDMAAGEGDSVVSYRNIPAIIKAQKEAATNAGAAFWDSYNAMGGKSSVIKWAEKDPPLAQKDYIHFTYPGADTLSSLLAQEVFFAKTDDILPRTVTLSRPDTLISQPGVIQTQTGNKFKNLAGSFITGILSYNHDKPLIFTAAAFWIFLLVVLAGYSLVYRKLALRNIYLFLVSLFFYYKTGGFFLFILIFVTLIDYTCGLLINRSEKKISRKFFLLLSIISNLGLLGYFKYTAFIINMVNDIFGTNIIAYDFLSALSNSVLGTSFDITYIILPVGISFFTFQSLSYTIDIYRRKMAPVRNIIDFGFYVSFFPHLVAGPIVRASFFMPQLYQEFRLNKREFSHALFMISKGLIKKIVISNFIALNLVDRVFEAPAIFSGFENLMAVYGYGLQIYCDFSGYTDIAIGVALLLGFRLPLNFNSPYKATSITDFWKRWHISLSQWLRDYLYISLGGNRRGKFRTYLNLMITMLIGGLWHGASLKFIVWGGLHGAGLVINKLWSALLGSYRKGGWLMNLIAMFITFNFVSFCWIFFRAPDFNSATLMMKQIAENFSPGSFITVISAYSNVLLIMSTGYIIHFLPDSIKESYRGFFIKIPVPAQMAVVLLVAVMLYQMRTIDVMPFIYFRF